MKKRKGIRKEGEAGNTRGKGWRKSIRTQDQVEEKKKGRLRRGSKGEGRSECRRMSRGTVAEKGSMKKGRRGGHGKKRKRIKKNYCRKNKGNVFKKETYDD